MSDIESWLDQHDLGEYANVFSENSVKIGDLPELSEDDIASLGLPLGPRRRLLRAIREMVEASTIASTSSPPPTKSASEAQASWSRQPDDRRPVTLLFADITQSTALTEKLDPEEAHAVLYGAVRRMCETVERHRGTVCRFMGDGLMAMFGVPTAFESQTREACSSALALQSAIEDYSRELEQKHGARLQIRVGLHAGEVVALQVGEGERTQWDASGPAVPIAARMEQTAAPGTIQMTDDTFNLVGSYFEAERLPAVSVKGVSDPIAVVRLLRSRQMDEERPGASDVPFIGRRTERGQLLSALRTCVEDDSGQTLYIRGEAGVGKTRLAEEVAREALALGFALHRALVLDFGVGKGQAAIPALVRSLLAIPASSGKTARNRVADQALADGLVVDGERVFLNDLLDLSQPPILAAEFESMDPERRRRGRRDLFRNLVARQSLTQPCLLLVEDVHWADEVTLDYLAEIIRLAADNAVVLLVTTRPSHDPLSTHWQLQIQDAPVSVLMLRPFRKAEAQRLAAQLGVLDEAIVSASIERSQGNPLFLMELLKTYQGDTNKALPTSVQTIVASRLDQLDPQHKAAAQAAAVLGQRFALEPLRAVLVQPDYDCEALIDARFIRPVADGFLFSHALVMEGVLASLLKDQRATLHSRAAQWFAARDLSLWARHLEMAEDPQADKAYLAAAREQTERFRFVSALGLAQDGLRLSADSETTASLHALCGKAHRGLGDSARAATAFEAALPTMSDKVPRCGILVELSHVYRFLGNYEAGLKALEDAELASELPETQVHIEFCRGNIYINLFNRKACEAAYTRAFALAKNSSSAELQATALGGLARFETLTGRVGKSGEYIQRCLDLCARENLSHIEAQFVHMAGVAAQWRGELAQARAYFEASTVKAPLVGDVRQAMVGNRGAAEVCFRMGDFDAAMAFANEAQRLSSLTGDRSMLPIIRAFVTKLMLLKDRREEAIAYLARAHEECRSEAFGWPHLLGVLVRFSSQESVRRDALAEGEEICSGNAYGLSVLGFFEEVIEAALENSDWAGVARHTGALEEFTQEDPLPLAQFIIERARALALHARGERGVELAGRLQALLSRARAMDFRIAMPALETAISNFNADSA